MSIKVEIDGEEKEVFTTEELEAQKQAAIDEFKTDIPDRSEEIQTLQDEITKLKDKDANFEKLRDFKKVGEGKLKVEEFESEKDLPI